MNVAVRSIITFSAARSTARQIAANIAKLPLVAPDGRCNW
jgi:hypothetical protein